jgi:hypothetical protein
MSWWQRILANVLGPTRSRRLGDDPSFGDDQRSGSGFSIFGVTIGGGDEAGEKAVGDSFRDEEGSGNDGDDGGDGGSDGGGDGGGDD